MDALDFPIPPCGHLGCIQFPHLAWYRLEGTQTIQETCFYAWGQFMAHDSRRVVELTEVAPAIVVSTVFLGYDANRAGGTPILFETMVFGPNMRTWTVQRRYHTYHAAEQGHAHICAVVRRYLRRKRLV